MRGEQKTKRDALRSKKQMEELATNKMLLVFGAATVYLFLITIIRNNGWITGTERSTAATVFYGAVSLITLQHVPLGLVLYYKMRKNGKQPQYRIVNWLNISVSALVVLFCTVMQYLFGGMGVKASYVAVVAAAALAIIYWVFRRECFVSMLVLGLSAVAYYLLYKLPYALSLWMSAWKLLAALYAVALLAGFAAVFLLRRKKGVVRVGRQNARLLDAKFNYLPVFAALAFVTLVFAACILLGTHYFYYAVFATAVVLVGYGVYFILLLI